MTDANQPVNRRHVSSFDVVLVVDPRLPPSETRSVAALLEAMVAHGWSIGLVFVLSGLPDPRRHLPRPIGRLLQGSQVRLIATPGPVSAELAIGYQLAPFLADPDRLVRISCGGAMLRVDQPIRSATGRRLVVLEEVVERARWMFGCTPLLAPVDSQAIPLDCRGPEVLAPGLWPPVASFADGAVSPRPAGDNLTVGYYPATPNARGPFDTPSKGLAEGLRLTLLTDEADALEPPPALRQVDGVLVCRRAPGNSATSITACEVEALALGIPIVAPYRMAEEWRPATVPLDDLLEAQNAAERRARLAEKAAGLLDVRAELTPDAWLRRLGEVHPDLHRKKRRSLHVRAVEQHRARVLFLSPNGVGMGHLTRQLAIARHLPPAVLPIFVSMSQAVGVVERFGFASEYVPGPRALGVDPARWAPDFTQRLLDIITFYDARAVIFDGNHPYQALLDARQHVRERPFIWLRRGLWRGEVGHAIVAREDDFDLVVEPDDFARTMDVGVTSESRVALRVPPITLLVKDDLLPRDEAREALMIPRDSFAVLIQLGSGANFDVSEIRDVALDECARIRGCRVRVVTWLISHERGGDNLGRGSSVRGLRGYPLARFARAFDVGISAAGYNSFHELLQLGLPTIFVPNENPMMDEQEARALYADRMGLGLCVRAHDGDRMIWALRALREPARRLMIEERRRLLPSANGARNVAALVALHALSLHARRDGPRIPRIAARW